MLTNQLTNQGIQISVNGAPYHVPPGSSITGVLELLNVAPDRVAVELNKMLVRKRDWDTTEVGIGSSVEVVEFVGGG